MNKPLLRRVKAAILKEPRRLDMAVPFYENRNAPCNTSACIAGWAVLLSERKGREPFLKTMRSLLKQIGVHQYGTWPNVQRRAIKLLGLTDRQADHLFHDENWPEPFREDFNDSFNLAPRKNWEKAQAQIAAKRIDYFIKEGR